MAMPREDSRKENLVFGLLMVVIMVLFMVTYNISLHAGGFSWSVMLTALKAFVPAAIIAFVIENLFVGKLAKRIAFKMVNPVQSEPIMITLAISVVTVLLMCPIMTLVATVLFEFPGSWASVIPTWLQTWTISLPAALLWNVCYGGPLARWIFGLIFRRHSDDTARELVKVAKKTK